MVRPHRRRGEGPEGPSLPNAAEANTGSGPGLSRQGTEVPFRQFEALAQEHGNAEAGIFGALLKCLHLPVIDPAGDDEFFRIGAGSAHDLPPSICFFEMAAL
jgi:hypothetical protein